MKITIESTTKLVTLNGVPARIWEGRSESGVKCHAYVTRIAVAEGEDQSAFEHELKEQRAPSEEIAAIPFRMIL
jgi:hypothetical protein